MFPCCRSFRGDTWRLANSRPVAAVIAREILANTAQEQAHVFRATMMLPTGSLTGVPCCAGAGSRGTKPWRHPTVPPPRGPSAVYGRPSRPFGLRSLTQTRGDYSASFFICKPPKTLTLFKSHRTRLSLITLFAIIGVKPLIISSTSKHTS